MNVLSRLSDEFQFNLTWYLSENLFVLFSLSSAFKFVLVSLVGTFLFLMDWYHGRDEHDFWDITRSLTFFFKWLLLELPLLSSDAVEYFFVFSRVPFIGDTGLTEILILAIHSFFCEKWNSKIYSIYTKSKRIKQFCEEWISLYSWQLNHFKINCYFIYI